MSLTMGNFKLEKELWETFKRVCKSQDLTASQVLRGAIKSYILKNGQAEMFR